MNEVIYKDYLSSKIKLINRLKNKSNNLSRINSNIDTFISINDYLADEISLGPKEDPGKILYQYTDFENLNDFIYLLVQDLKFEDILCLTNFYSKLKNGIVSNSISYNYDKDFLAFPKNLTNILQNCSNKRFIYINFIIYWESFDLTHSNVIIIDNLEKTIERFEPRGKSDINDPELLIAKKIDSKFSSSTLKLLGLSDFIYLSPIKTLPLIGPQSIANAYEGMCVTYSLLYLHLRIMNPDINRDIIIKYLISKTSDELLNIILRYAKYVEIILKRKSNIVKERREILYSKYLHEINEYYIISDNKINSIKL